MNPAKKHTSYIYTVAHQIKTFFLACTNQSMYLILLQNNSRHKKKKRKEADPTIISHQIINQIYGVPSVQKPFCQKKKAVLYVPSTIAPPLQCLLCRLLKW